MDPNDLDAATHVAQLTKGMHRKMYPLLEPTRPEFAEVADGKNVLITGVSGGIAPSIAEAWAIAGAAGVAITGRNVEALDEAAKKVKSVARSPSIKVVVHPADITSEDSVKELYSKLGEDLGTIDVLINSAGSMGMGFVGQSEPTRWWQDFEVNTKGTYLMSHFFLKQANDGHGTIIVVGTGAAGVSFPYMSSYNTSKGAQTRILDFVHEENPNIRTFTLLPGLVDTNMTQEMFKPYALDDPMLSGGLSLFLCTARAEWMRGGVVSVNWDIEEMEAHKEEIQREGRIRTRYINAKLQKGGHPWEN